jgi:hypothetical protein
MAYITPDKQAELDQLAKEDDIYAQALADYHAAIAAGTGGSGQLAIDLASTSLNKGAAKIGVHSTGHTAEVDITAALAGVAAAVVATDLASLAHNKGAHTVGLEDAANLLAAGDLEAAVLELVKYQRVALADPGTGVAIPVTRSAQVDLTVGSAGAETNTLAIPVFAGQSLVLNAAVVGTGTRAVTCAQAINKTGNTIMTFAAARDFVMLVAVKLGSALRWEVAAIDGAVLS